MAEAIVRVPTAEEMSQVFDLRWKVLRAPLGEGLEHDDLDYSEGTVHGAVFVDERLVATGRLNQTLADPTLLQVRYMATDPEYRGRGYGQQILWYMESLAQHVGAEAIILNARIDARSLYERVGYSVCGPEFELRGLRHLPMQKELV